MSKTKVLVFLDVSIDGDPYERMIFELFTDVAPKTCENFRALCTGEKGVSAKTGKPLHYKGTFFHRITEGYVAQGGDFLRKDGNFGESIYGGKFPDELPKLRHDGPGLLSMAIADRDERGSLFSITFKADHHLDRKNIVFGKLVKGHEVLKKIEKTGHDEGEPTVTVKIVNSGELRDGNSNNRKNKEIQQDMIKHDVTPTSSPPPADGQLPNDIIELILSKCPVKSVIKFKSVSKLWQSIISHPRFFRSLESRLSENHKHKFIMWPRRKACIMIVEDGNCRRESALGYPFISDSPICSCNGLILLYGPSYKDYVLWNPLIRKHIIIPPPWKWNISLLNFQHHLYYDSVTEDYRIVLASEGSYDVFSCKSGSWGERKYFPSDDDCKGSYRNPIVDGCLYRMHGGGGIICFDVRDGKLHNLPRPKEVEGLFQAQMKEVTGRLCLYGFTDEGQKRLQLWVMEKNKNDDDYCWNWRKLISMEKEDPFIQNLRPVCLTNEDDVVLCDSEKHFLYNSSRNDFQDLGWDSYSYCYPYSENLLLPTST